MLKWQPIQHYSIIFATKFQLLAKQFKLLFHGPSMPINDNVFYENLFENSIVKKNLFHDDFLAPKILKGNHKLSAALSD